MEAYYLFGWQSTWTKRALLTSLESICKSKHMAFGIQLKINVSNSYKKPESLLLPTVKHNTVEKITGNVSLLVDNSQF